MKDAAYIEIPPKIYPGLLEFKLVTFQSGSCFSNLQATNTPLDSLYKVFCHGQHLLSTWGCFFYYY